MHLVVKRLDLLHSRGEAVVGFHGAATGLGKTTAQFHVVPVNGFNSSATVSILPPAGFNGSLTADSPTVSAGGDVNVRATATMAAQPGVYQFSVRLTSGSLTHDQAVSLTVEKAPRHRAAR